MADLFRVSWNRKGNTYTLIQEGITLTAEQAFQISTAFNMSKEEQDAGNIDELPMLENWIPNGNDKIFTD